MGRRRGRKRDRKQQQREHVDAWHRAPPVFDEPHMPRTEEDGLLAIVHRRKTPKTCERCFEFVPDAEGGRGRCLHPASGIFAPWSDTNACGYYRNRV